jgi:hypothetical protein
MGFLDRPAAKSSNPTAKFLEWKSEQKKFAYYDKEQKQNVFVDLPLTFLVLEEYHTVKGFSDSDQTGIYANEVLSTGGSEMEIKTFKGRIIAKGLYKDIKSIVEAAGGRYHKSIYAVTSDGELVNISIKGASVREWSEFTAKGAFRRLKDEWVTVASAKDQTKGRVNYSTPVFKFDKSLDDSEFEMVASQAKLFEEYMDEYLAPKQAKEAGHTNEEPYVQDEEDLAF